ncbi:probable RNA methyltransferase CG11342 [Agrilus planipennis]|uniref:RNA methyltransferase n=1 Tax=Agrilus planipennis TaxID=224129 RepID=A0A7F5R9T6_AGRPL|nr:probable RNA methyltransferase CG11342 [Agrilus planipennis]
MDESRQEGINTLELNFKNGNPGAVQYGNFINYYQFHSPQSRLRLLPSGVEIWSTFTEKTFALDIGSNAGDLTYLLHSFLEEKLSQDCEIIGVDIDPVLIERAKDKRPCNKLKFLCLDFMNENGRSYILNYLIDNNLSKFNVIFCFSITMWIHLNHGDKGLENFIYQVLNLGEVVVIEPQPWKCYRTAVKRLKRSNEQFPLFNKLKIRNVEEEIQNMIDKMFGKNIRLIYKSQTTEWGRKILIYKWNREVLLA